MELQRYSASYFYATPILIGHNRKHTDTTIQYPHFQQFLTHPECPHGVRCFYSMLQTTCLNFTSNPPLLTIAHRILIAALTKSWGSWRCNALAFAGTVTAARYVARLELEERKPVLESAFFMALVNQGLGTVSGEQCSLEYFVVVDVVFSRRFSPLLPCGISGLV